MTLPVIKAGDVVVDKRNGDELEVVTVTSKITCLLVLGINQNGNKTTWPINRINQKHFKIQ